MIKSILITGANIVNEGRITRGDVFGPEILIFKTGKDIFRDGT